MSRAVDLDAVRERFRASSELELRTTITGIQYIEPGRRALVTVHKKEQRRLHGNLERFSSLCEVEAGFEDGWIFFARNRRTAYQAIPAVAPIEF